MKVTALARLLLVMECIGSIAVGPSAEAHRAKITLAPYLWAPTINGRVSLGPLALPLRATPGQLASGLRAGAMGSATIEKDRGFIGIEVIAIDFKRNQFAPVLSQDVAARVISIEGVAGYTFSIGKNLVLRPIAGIRYNSLTVDVGTAPANLAVSGAWIEPLVGGVATIRVGERWTVTAKADRGIGGQDRRSFDARADIDYRLARRVSVFAGYRHTAQYYASSGTPAFTIDLRGDGPIVGLRGRF
jgi:hypothetical protein